MKITYIITLSFAFILLATASEIKSPLSAWSAVYLVKKSENNSIKCYEIFRKFEYGGNEDLFLKGIESWTVTSKNKYWIYSIKVDEKLNIIKSNSKALTEVESSKLEDALLNLEKSALFQIPAVPAAEEEDRKQ
jgi:hypothetical protein